jgi:hypothetical protein
MAYLCANGLAMDHAKGWVQLCPPCQPQIFIAFMVIRQSCNKDTSRYGGHILASFWQEPQLELCAGFAIANCPMLIDPGTALLLGKLEGQLPVYFSSHANQSLRIGIGCYYSIDKPSLWPVCSNELRYQWPKWVLFCRSQSSAFGQFNFSKVKFRKTSKRTLPHAEPTTFSKNCEGR